MKPTKNINLRTLLSRWSVFNKQYFILCELKMRFAKFY